MSASNQAAACASPISWLRLERHHLGETHDERDAIAEHLRSCPACAALLGRIAEDDARELAPLPSRPVASRPWYAGRPRMMAAVSGLALAAALLLTLGRRPHPQDPAEGSRIKGSDLAFTLVREDEAFIAEAGGAYRDGERFKALVTCPPGMRASFDVAVFEQGAVSFPLPQSHELACGNASALPGAFRVTGREPMTACLVWQLDGPVDRDAIRRSAAPEALPNALCKMLSPSP